MTAGVPLLQPAALLGQHVALCLTATYWWPADDAGGLDGRPSKRRHGCCPQAGAQLRGLFTEHCIIGQRAGDVFKVGRAELKGQAEVQPCDVSTQP
jgi:hypothetical protein